MRLCQRRGQNNAENDDTRQTLDGSIQVHTRTMKLRSQLRPPRMAIDLRQQQSDAGRGKRRAVSTFSLNRNKFATDEATDDLCSVGFYSTNKLRLSRNRFVVGIRSLLEVICNTPLAFPRIDFRYDFGEAFLLTGHLQGQSTIAPQQRLE